MYKFFYIKKKILNFILENKILLNKKIKNLFKLLHINKLIF